MTTPKRPTRARPKLITAAEQEAKANRDEIVRLGRVARHTGKARDTSPYGEDDPLRELWLHAWDTARLGARPDFRAVKAAGWAAYQDGVRRNECPYGRAQVKDRSEWLDGWDHAKRAKDKSDEDAYR